MIIKHPPRLSRTATRRAVCRGLMAAPLLINPRLAKPQVFVEPYPYLTPAQYAAQGLGMSFHFNMAVFFNVQFAPTGAALNSFAPTTTDFVDNWISNALAAKAKYVLLTVKHRNDTTTSPSFCLWPTATNSYNVSNTTWYMSGGGFDIVQQFTNKARAAGLKVVLYWQPAGDTLANCQAQLTELTSNYGTIAAIWLDGPDIHSGTVTPWPSAAAMMSFMHSLQPGILLVANMHPPANLNHTDVFEYEGPGIKVPNGNTSPAEQIDSMFVGNSDTNYFYQTYIPSTTATAGSANTVTLPGGSGVNNFYAGMDVIINSGTGAGQRLSISSYDGTTKIFTMASNWGTVPDTTSVCTVLPEIYEATDLQTELTTTNGNAATYLLNASPDTTGHVPSDQATVLAAFGAMH